MPPAFDHQIPVVEAAEIVVDAVAAEPAWREAERVTGFVVYEPEVDGEPVGQTEVLVLADRRALYLFFSARDPEPERLRASLGRRDSRGADDQVGLYLDPSGEAQRAYVFEVNPLGVQSDGVRAAAGEGVDLSWDARWESAARITAWGYEVEVAIPWRSVQHPTGREHLGLIFTRQVARRAERSAWPRLDPDVRGLLVQQALFAGPGVLPASRGLDLVPELVWGWSQDGPMEHALGAWGCRPGMTMGWSLGSATELLGTLNPDFSQVESDAYQIDVNQRYALHYEEKRPFFLEGREWFEHPLAEVVYSRAVVEPLYGARASVDRPGWTLSAVHALDAQPGPTVSEGGGWSEEDLEGRSALATVLRPRLELVRDGYLGLLLSDRSLPEIGLANRLGGLDGRLRLGDRLVGSGSALLSHTSFAGGSAAFGSAGNLQLDYSEERFWAGTWAAYYHPDFRAENGYVPTADFIGGGGSSGVVLRPGWRALPRVSLSLVDGWIGWTHDGELRSLREAPTAWLLLGNGTSVVATGSFQGESYAGAWLEYQRASLGFGGDWSQWLGTWIVGSSGTAPYYDAEDARVGWSDSVAPSVTLRPWPGLSLGFWGSYERFLELGTPLYAGWVWRARLEAFASRALSFRAILDRSDFAETWAGEVLVAWEPSQGRALYLAGSLAEGDVLEWALFTKASWVFER